MEHMIISKTKKRHRYEPFQRTSLLVRWKSKHRLKAISYSFDEKPKRRSHSRRLAINLYRTYRSLCVTVTLVFRLFTYIDRAARNIFLFIERIAQIIRVVYGWIQMLRSILSALHLITSRIMIISSHVHRIFQLLTILLQPFANRQIENAGRSLSHFVFYYYSSDGACYTLQARTRQIVRRVRQRWKGKYYDEEEIYYDALSEESLWL